MLLRPFAVALLLLAASPAAGAPQLWRWSAVGVAIDGTGGGAYPWLGAELAGRLAFDPATAPVAASGALALYLPGEGSSLELHGEGLAFRAGKPGGGFLSVADGFAGCSLDVAFAGPCDLLAFSAEGVLEGAGGVLAGTLRLVLADTRASALHDTGLPGVVPALGDFDLRQVEFVSDAPGVLRARAELVALVPEPSSGALVAVGLAVLGRRRRSPRWR